MACALSSPEWLLLNRKLNREAISSPFPFQNETKQRAKANRSRNQGRQRSASPRPAGRTQPQPPKRPNQASPTPQQGRQRSISPLPASPNRQRVTISRAPVVTHRCDDITRPCCHTQPTTGATAQRLAPSRGRTRAATRTPRPGEPHPATGATAKRLAPPSKPQPPACDNITRPCCHTQA